MNLFLRQLQKTPTSDSDTSNNVLRRRDSSLYILPVLRSHSLFVVSVSALFASVHILSTIQHYCSLKRKRQKKTGRIFKWLEISISPLYFL